MSYQRKPQPPLTVEEQTKICQKLRLAIEYPPSGCWKTRYWGFRSSTQQIEIYVRDDRVRVARKATKQDATLIKIGDRTWRADFPGVYHSGQKSTVFLTLEGGARQITWRPEYYGETLSFYREESSSFSALVAERTLLKLFSSYLGTWADADARPVAKLAEFFRMVDLMNRRFGEVNGRTNPEFDDLVSAIIDNTEGQTLLWHSHSNDVPVVILTVIASQISKWEAYVTQQQRRGLDFWAESDIHAAVVMFVDKYNDYLKSWTQGLETWHLREVSHDGCNQLIESLTQLKSAGPCKGIVSPESVLVVASAAAATMKKRLPEGDDQACSLQVLVVAMYAERLQKHEKKAFEEEALPRVKQLLGEIPILATTQTLAECILALCGSYNHYHEGHMEYLVKQTIPDDRAGEVLFELFLRKHENRLAKNCGLAKMCLGLARDQSQQRSILSRVLKLAKQPRYGGHTIASQIDYISMWVGEMPCSRGECNEIRGELVGQVLQECSFPLSGLHYIREHQSLLQGEVSIETLKMLVKKTQTHGRVVELEPQQWRSILEQVLDTHGETTMKEILNMVIEAIPATTHTPYAFCLLQLCEPNLREPQHQSFLEDVCKKLSPLKVSVEEFGQHSNSRCTSILMALWMPKADAPESVVAEHIGWLDIETSRFGSMEEVIDKRFITSRGQPLHRLLRGPIDGEDKLDFETDWASFIQVSWPVLCDLCKVFAHTLDRPLPKVCRMFIKLFDAVCEGSLTTAAYADLRRLCAGQTKGSLPVLIENIVSSLAYQNQSLPEEEQARVFSAIEEKDIRCKELKELTTEMAKFLEWYLQENQSDEGESFFKELERTKTGYETMTLLDLEAAQRGQRNLDFLAFDQQHVRFVLHCLKSRSTLLHPMLDRLKHCTDGNIDDIVAHFVNLCRRMVVGETVDLDVWQEMWPSVVEALASNTATLSRQLDIIFNFYDPDNALHERRCVVESAVAFYRLCKQKQVIVQSLEQLKADWVLKLAPFMDFLSLHNKFGDVVPLDGGGDTQVVRACLLNLGVVVDTDFGVFHALLHHGPQVFELIASRKDFLEDSNYVQGSLQIGKDTKLGPLAELDSCYHLLRVFLPGQLKQESAGAFAELLQHLSKNRHAAKSARIVWESLSWIRDEFESIGRVGGATLLQAVKGILKDGRFLVDPSTGRYHCSYEGTTSNGDIVHMSEQQVQDFVARVSIEKGESDLPEADAKRILSLLRIYEIFRRAGDGLKSLCEQLFKEGHPIYRQPQVCFEMKLQENEAEEEEEETEEEEVEEAEEDGASGDQMELQKQLECLERQLERKVEAMQFELSEWKRQLRSTFKKAPSLSLVPRSLIFRWVATMVDTCGTGSVQEEISSNIADLTKQENLNLPEPPEFDVRAASRWSLEVLATWFKDARVNLSTAGQPGRAIVDAEGAAAEDICAFVMEQFCGESSSRLPLLTEVLFCTPSTDIAEVKALLWRCKEFQAQTFVLVEPNLLSAEAAQVVIGDLTSSAEGNLIVICTSPFLSSTAALEHRQLQRGSQMPRTLRTVQRWRGCCPAQVFLYPAEKTKLWGPDQVIPGLSVCSGKTFTINKMLEEHPASSFSCTCHEGFSLKELVELLQGRNNNGNPVQYLHLEISPYSDFEQVNKLLNGLLMHGLFFEPASGLAASVASPFELHVEIQPLVKYKDPFAVRDYASVQAHVKRFEDEKDPHLAQQCPLLRLLGQNGDRAGLKSRPLLPEALNLSPIIESSMHPEAVTRLPATWVDDFPLLPFKVMEAGIHGRFPTRGFLRAPNCRDPTDVVLQLMELKCGLSIQQGQKVEQCIFVKLFATFAEWLATNHLFQEMDQHELNSKLSSLLDVFCCSLVFNKEKGMDEPCLRLVLGFSGQFKGEFLAFGPGLSRDGHCHRGAGCRCNDVREQFAAAFPDRLKISNGKAESKTDSYQQNIEAIAMDFGLKQEKVKHAFEKDHFILSVDVACKLLELHRRHRAGLPLILEGESGTGKSRLVAVFAKLLSMSSEVESDPLIQLYDHMRDLLTQRKKDIGSRHLKPISELMDSLLKKGFTTQRFKRILSKEALWSELPTTTVEGSPTSPIFESSALVDNLLKSLTQSKRWDIGLFVFLAAKSLDDEGVQSVKDIRDKALRQWKEMTNTEKEEHRSQDPLKAIQRKADHFQQELLPTLIDSIVELPQEPVFFPVLLHSMVTPEELKELCEPAVRACRRDPGTTHILFLDETNTSSLLGMIQHMLAGGVIEECSNLFIVNAVNPFRPGQVEAEPSQQTSTKDMMRDVFQVHPSPASFDPFTLNWRVPNEGEEGEYTLLRLQGMMAEELEIEQVQVQDCLQADEQESDDDESDSEESVPERHHTDNVDIDLMAMANTLLAANKFMREKLKSPSAASQRNIMRFEELFRFFRRSLSQEKETTRILPSKRAIYAKAFLLAIGMECVLRLSSELREEFHKDVTGPLCSDWISKDIPVEEDVRVVLSDEMDYYFSPEHISLPSGVALTRGLKENMFAVIVCTQCNVPVSLFGKPGTSKTLGATLSIQKLRGPDSTTFFRSFVAIYNSILRYQCSKESTSTEIDQMFVRATRMQKNYDHDGKDFRAGVLIDEASLPAGNNDGLKVMHFHLDAGAVMAIVLSNEPLDAAKQNRLLGVHREAADNDDCFALTTNILGVDGKDSTNQSFAQGLCTAFQIITNDPTFDIFHLRDYTCFVEHLRKRGYTDSVQVLRALERNFGGRKPEDFKVLVEMVFEQIQMPIPMERSFRSPIQILQDWVHDILTDEELQAEVFLLARYLMLVDKTEDGSGMLILQAERCKQSCLGSELVIEVSDFPNDNKQMSENEVVSRTRCAANQPGIHLITEPGNALDGFYEWLNRSSTPLSGKSRTLSTTVAVGSESVKTAVSADCKPVICMREKEFSSRPLPLLNRLEKVQIGADDLAADVAVRLGGNAMSAEFFKGYLSHVVHRVEVLVGLAGPHSLIGYHTTDTLWSLVAQALPKVEDKLATLARCPMPALPSASGSASGRSAEANSSGGLEPEGLPTDLELSNLKKELDSMALVSQWNARYKDVTCKGHENAGSTCFLQVCLTLCSIHTDLLRSKCSGCDELDYLFEEVIGRSQWLTVQRRQMEGLESELDKAKLLTAHVQDDAAMMLDTVLDRFGGTPLKFQAVLCSPDEEASGLPETDDFARLVQSKTEICQDYVLRVPLTGDSRKYILQDLIRQTMRCPVQGICFEGTEHEAWSGVRVIQRLPQQKPPVLLPVVLNRYREDGTKNGANVEVPLVDLRVPFQSPSSAPLQDGPIEVWKYNLRSFFVHEGSTEKAGHYVAYFRKPDESGNDTWYCVSNATVKTMKLHQVKAVIEQAYVVMYELAGYLPGASLSKDGEIIESAEDETQMQLTPEEQEHKVESEEILSTLALEVAKGLLQLAPSELMAALHLKVPAELVEDWLKGPHFGLGGSIARLRTGTSKKCVLYTRDYMSGAAGAISSPSRKDADIQEMPKTMAGVVSLLEKHKKSFQKATPEKRKPLFLLCRCSQVLRSTDALTTKSQCSSPEFSQMAVHQVRRCCDSLEVEGVGIILLLQPQWYHMSACYSAIFFRDWDFFHLDTLEDDDAVRQLMVRVLNPTQAHIKADGPSAKIGEKDFKDDLFQVTSCLVPQQSFLHCSDNRDASIFYNRNLGTRERQKALWNILQGHPQLLEQLQSISEFRGQGVEAEVEQAVLSIRGSGSGQRSLQSLQDTVRTRIAQRRSAEVAQVLAVLCDGEGLVALGHPDAEAAAVEFVKAQHRFIDCEEASKKRQLQPAQKRAFPGYFSKVFGAIRDSFMQSADQASEEKFWRHHPLFRVAQQISSSEYLFEMYLSYVLNQCNLPETSFKFLQKLLRNARSAPDGEKRDLLQPVQRFCCRNGSAIAAAGILLENCGDVTFDRQGSLDELLPAGQLLNKELVKEVIGSLEGQLESSLSVTEEADTSSLLNWQQGFQSLKSILDLGKAPQPSGDVLKSFNWMKFANLLVDGIQQTDCDFLRSLWEKVKGLTRHSGDPAQLHRLCFEELAHHMQQQQQPQQQHQAQVPEDGEGQGEPETPGEEVDNDADDDAETPSEGDVASSGNRLILEKLVFDMLEHAQRPHVTTLILDVLQGVNAFGTFKRLVTLPFGSTVLKKLVSLPHITREINDRISPKSCRFWPLANAAGCEGVTKTIAGTAAWEEQLSHQVFHAFDGIPDELRLPPSEDLPRMVRTLREKIQDHNPSLQNGVFSHIKSCASRMVLVKRVAQRLKSPQHIGALNENELSSLHDFFDLIKAETEGVDMNLFLATLREASGSNGQAARIIDALAARGEGFRQQVGDVAEMFRWASIGARPGEDPILDLPREKDPGYETPAQLRQREAAGGAIPAGFAAIMDLLQNRPDLDFTTPEAAQAAEQRLQGLPAWDRRYCIAKAVACLYAKAGKENVNLSRALKSEDCDALRTALGFVQEGQHQSAQEPRKLAIVLAGLCAPSSLGFASSPALILTNGAGGMGGMNEEGDEEGNTFSKQLQSAVLNILVIAIGSPGNGHLTMLLTNPPEMIGTHPVSSTCNSVVGHGVHYDCGCELHEDRDANGNVGHGRTSRAPFNDIDRHYWHFFCWASLAIGLVFFPPKYAEITPILSPGLMPPFAGGQDVARLPSKEFAEVSQAFSMNFAKAGFALIQRAQHINGEDRALILSSILIQYRDYIIAQGLARNLRTFPTNGDLVVYETQLKGFVTSALEQRVQMRAAALAADSAIAALDRFDEERSFMLRFFPDFHRTCMAIPDLPETSYVHKLLQMQSTLKHLPLIGYFAAIETFLMEHFHGKVRESDVERPILELVREKMQEYRKAARMSDRKVCEAFEDRIYNRFVRVYKDFFEESRGRLLVDCQANHAGGIATVLAEIEGNGEDLSMKFFLDLGEASQPRLITEELAKQWNGLMSAAASVPGLPTFWAEQIHQELPVWLSGYLLQGHFVELAEQTSLKTQILSKLCGVAADGLAIVDWEIAQQDLLGQHACWLRKLDVVKNLKFEFMHDDSAQKPETLSTEKQDLLRQRAAAFRRLELEASRKFVESASKVAAATDDEDALQQSLLGAMAKDDGTSLDRVCTEVFKDFELKDAPGIFDFMKSLPTEFADVPQLLKEPLPQGLDVVQSLQDKLNLKAISGLPKINELDKQVSDAICELQTRNYLGLLGSPNYLNRPLREVWNEVTQSSDDGPISALVVEVKSKHLEATLEAFRQLLQSIRAQKDEMEHGFVWDHRVTGLQYDKLRAEQAALQRRDAFLEESDTTTETDEEGLAPQTVDEEASQLLSTLPSELLPLIRAACRSDSHDLDQSADESVCQVPNHLFPRHDADEEDPAFQSWVSSVKSRAPCDEDGKAYPVCVTMGDVDALVELVEVSCEGRRHQKVGSRGWMTALEHYNVRPLKTLMDLAAAQEVCDEICMELLFGNEELPTPSEERMDLWKRFVRTLGTCQSPELEAALGKFACPGSMPEIVRDVAAVLQSATEHSRLLLCNDGQYFEVDMEGARQMSMAAMDSKRSRLQGMTSQPSTASDEPLAATVSTEPAAESRQDAKLPTEESSGSAEAAASTASLVQDEATEEQLAAAPAPVPTLAPESAAASAPATVSVSASDAETSAPGMQAASGEKEDIALVQTVASEASRQEEEGVNWWAKLQLQASDDAQSEANWTPPPSTNSPGGEVPQQKSGHTSQTTTPSNAEVTTCLPTLHEWLAGIEAAGKFEDCSKHWQQLASAGYESIEKLVEATDDEVKQLEDMLKKGGMKLGPRKSFMNALKKLRADNQPGEVGQWLAKNGLKHLQQAFLKAGVKTLLNLAELTDLEDDDFEELGVTQLGDQARFREALALLPQEE